MPKGNKVSADAAERLPTASSEVAYQRLFEAILEGRLRPGQRLRETELAAALGVSRTPIREALWRLEVQGLVAHAPRKGMVIRTLEHQEITELYLMREVLEGTAARLAARHASEAEVLTLDEMVREDAERLDDPEALARSNRTFHETLYRAAHNRYLLQLLAGLRASMSLLGRSSLYVEGRAAAALAEHEEIVSAISAHDSDGAEAAARRHIRSAHRARLKILATTSPAWGEAPMASAFRTGAASGGGDSDGSGH